MKIMMEIVIAFAGSVKFIDRLKYNTQIIYFLISSGFGGGRCLSSSGLRALVPSPFCSHGDRDSKLLSSTTMRLRGYSQTRGYVPERLGELKRFVNNTFTFLVITDFGVALKNISTISLETLLSVNDTYSQREIFAQRVSFET
jgi:hypothetical protein